MFFVLFCVAGVMTNCLCFLDLPSHGSLEVATHPDLPGPISEEGMCYVFCLVLGCCCYD